MVNLKLIYWYVITGLCLSLSSFSYATMVVYPREIYKGVEYRSPLYVSAARTEGPGSSIAVKDAGLFLISKRINGNGADTSCLPSSSFTWTSDGKYYGLKVGEDTVIAIIDATSISSAELEEDGNSSTAKYYHGGGTWDSKGVFTSDPKFLPLEETEWCSGKPFLSTRYISGRPVDGTMNGTLVLYAGPKAKIGHIQLPELYWNLTIGGDRISGETGVDIKKKLSCSIAPPAPINFGEVRLWNSSGNSTGTRGGEESDVLDSRDGEIVIQCQADSPDEGAATASLTLIGETREYATNLKVSMDDTNEMAPAVIRGSILNLQPSCATNKSINFEGSEENADRSRVNIGALGATGKNIPYRFSLCSYPDNGVKHFGPASAKATIILNWD